MMMMMMMGVGGGVFTGTCSRESQKRINPVIMDIHNSIMDIHNSIRNIHNCKPITNKAVIMDIHNQLWISLITYIFYYGQR